MKKKMLTVFTYGLLELGALIIFSSFVWLNVLSSSEISYIQILNCMIIFLAIVTTIWMFFSKKKARLFMIINFIRFSLLLLAIVLSNLSIIFGESETPEYRLISPIIVAIFSVAFHYIKETKHWSDVIQTWQKINKIDLEAKQFNISVPNYLMTKGGEKNIEKAAAFYVPAWFLLSLLDIFWGDGFKNLFLRVGSLFVTYVFAMGVGKFAAWMVNFIKMEKTMQVEFVTEYGDVKKMARLSR